MSFPALRIRILWKAGGRMLTEYFVTPFARLLGSLALLALETARSTFYQFNLLDPFQFRIWVRFELIRGSWLGTCTRMARCSPRALVTWLFSQFSVPFNSIMVHFALDLCPLITTASLGCELGSCLDSPVFLATWLVDRDLAHYARNLLRTWYSLTPGSPS